MTDERKYFGSREERNKFVLENKDKYVIGQQGNTYFVEKKVLTEQQAANLGYSKKSRKSLSSGGRLAPTPIESIVGTPEQVKDEILKRYESGALPQQYSAKIVSRPDAPHASTVTFTRTPTGQQSIIQYDSYKDIAQPVELDGKAQFVYELDVTTPEQARDVKIWAAAHGYTARRSTDDTRTAAELNKLSAEERRAAGSIKMKIYTDEALPPDTSIDIRSGDQLAQERVDRQAGGIGRQVYDKANIGEKILLNVRTSLRPAGVEYVGALAREHSDPVTRALIDLAFPGIPSSQEVVIKDVGKAVGEQAMGRPKTQRYGVNVAGGFLGVEVPDYIVDFSQSPVFEVEMMALGGAGLGAAAATGTGARILGSAAGKLAAVGVTGLYAGERTGKILTLRSQGKSAEALGTGITAAAGLAAGTAAFKAEYSHIIRARAENIVKVDIKQVKGGSISKQVGKSTTVSRGKFRITEGKLKGLTGETASISGKKGGYQVTKIPGQTVGSGKSKIKIPEQTFKSFTEHGTLSKKLKISWRKAGDMLLNVKSGDKSYTKIVGPRRETALTQEIGRRSGTINKQEVVVRKFSGVGVGKTARKYDLYLVQKGNKLLLAEQSVIGSKSLSKVDWIDISPVKAGGSGGSGTGSFPGVKIIRGAGGMSKTVTTLKTASPSTPPPTPPSNLNIKVQPAASKSASSLMARIVPNVNPVPMPVRVKEVPGLKTVPLITGTPKIVSRMRTQDKERTVVARSPGQVVVPSIIHTQSGKLKDIVTVAGKTLPITITHPITGQAVTPKERTAVLTQLEPIIDRVPSQPVTPVPITPNIFVPPGIGMIPFLRLGPGKFNIEKALKAVKTNPVPDIKKVI